jgi:isochorismate hydrolase
MMGQRVGDADRTVLHADAPPTQVHDDIDPRDGDIVVRKTRVGPFGTTDLDERLRSRGIDTLILAGISTSGVVLSAVRDGHARDYRLIVVSDLCTDPEPDVHAFLVQRVFPRQAEVITRDDLTRRLALNRTRRRTTSRTVAFVANRMMRIHVDRPIHRSRSARPQPLGAA